MQPRYRATFTSDPRNVARARAAVGSFARLCGFADEAVAEIQLAAGEALSNAAEHGRSERLGAFTVLCEMDDDELRVVVRDSGRGFDSHRAITGESAFERGRGFGIGIMRALMDTIDYSREGTQVSLVRHLDLDV